MTTLHTTITPKQWQVLLLVGIDVPAESIHCGNRIIRWPLEDTPKHFWKIKNLTPRHKAKAKPYINLQVALFNAWRHHRATHS